MAHLVKMEHVVLKAVLDQMALQVFLDNKETLDSLVDKDQRETEDHLAKQ